MSLDRQSGRPMSRRERQQRALQFSAAGAGSGVAFVVTGILAAITSFPTIVPIVLLLVAVACFVMFRRTVSGG